MQRSPPVPYQRVDPLGSLPRALPWQQHDAEQKETRSVFFTFFFSFFGCWFVAAAFRSDPLWSEKVGNVKKQVNTCWQARPRSRSRPRFRSRSDKAGPRREQKRASSSGASFYLPKTFSYSCRISSTIWFW